MNAGDVVLGIVIIFLLAWNAMLQLNIANLSNTVAGIAGVEAGKQLLFSPKEFCLEKQGMRLVAEEQLSAEEYIVTAGKNNEQTFFCFYKKTG